MKMLEFILSFIPTALPLTPSELTRWANTVFGMAPEVPDTASTRFYLLTTLLHLKEARNGYPLSRVPKRYFVKALQRARTNEVAYEQMEVMKAAEKARMAEAQAKTEAEKYKASQESEAPKACPLKVVPDDKN